MKLALLVFAAACAAVTRAELTLAPVFTDHMVLQRDVPLPVWGRAAPGASVVVEFAGERQSAVVDASGHWRVRLTSHQASAEPRALRVASGTESRKLDDILVGEVWLCAGQSNMEWPLAKEMHAEAEIPRATHSLVRLFNPRYSGKDRGGIPFDPDEVQQLAAERYFRGAWAVCTPETAGPCSAIGYYFAVRLAASLGVPVGIVQLAVGGSPAESWMRRDTLAADSELRQLLSEPWLENPALETWCRQRARENLDRAIAAGEVAARESPHPFRPGFLWAAAIEPLAPFALRGILWYQGESNALRADRVRQHETMFPLLVRDLRARWAEGNLPFLYCQLSGIDAAHYRSEYWPEFRDSQRRLRAKVPHTGMVVTTDLGDPTNVHPRDKRSVARRLAQVALVQAYGRNALAVGPEPQHCRARGDDLEITFASVGSGLAASDGAELAGFEVAGADGRFLLARARLGGNSVIITCDGVTAPQRMRYNWRPFPHGNLVNSVGLPASTFAMEAIR